MVCKNFAFANKFANKREGSIPILLRINKKFRISYKIIKESYKLVAIATLVCQSHFRKLGPPCTWKGEVATEEKKG